MPKISFEELAGIINSEFGYPYVPKGGNVMASYTDAGDLWILIGDRAITIGQDGIVQGVTDGVKPSDVPGAEPQDNTEEG